VLMAGGSLPNLPAGIDKGFLKDAAQMNVIASTNGNQYVLGNPNKGYIVYTKNGDISLDLSKSNKTFMAKWITPSTGVSTKGEMIKGGKELSLKAPQNGAMVLWLTVK